MLLLTGEQTSQKKTLRDILQLLSGIGLKRYLKEHWEDIDVKRETLEGILARQLGP
jgi:hypothetical protein